MFDHLRISALLVGLGLVSGCATLPTPDQMSFANVTASADRLLDDGLRDVPFADGPVTVISAEDGRLRTYLLVPCRDGTMICAGGLHGHAAALTTGVDFKIVLGAYRGHDFYLSPGGDGVVITRTGQYPIAWE